MTKNPRLESVGTTHNTAESVVPTIAPVFNPLERLTPEEVRAAYEFYVGQYRNLRLTICQSLEAQALADGLPPRDDVLDWCFTTTDELGRALNDANGFLVDADKLEIGFTLDWLECVMTLRGQLEDAFLMFISATREGNS